jgi:hypothetical protein
LPRPPDGATLKTVDEPGWRTSILDDGNPFRGLGPDGASRAERLRSAKRMAVIAPVLALLWGFGFFSVGALGAAFGADRHLRVEEPGSGYRTVVRSAYVLGALGVGITVYFGIDAVSEMGG